MKGAEQTMNGIEKVFENMSSIDKVNDFVGLPNSIIFGDEGSSNVDSTMYMYNSDDQRYSNTISSTSSTRSSTNAHKSAKSNKNSFVHIAKSKSKTNKSSPSYSQEFRMENNDVDFEHDDLHLKNKKSDLAMKKAINRYGTIPKGTQINAYLDSLQDNENFIDMNMEVSVNDSAIDRFNLETTISQDSNILTLQHPPIIPPLPSTHNVHKVSTSTFTKDSNDKHSSVAILDDISNQASNSEFKPSTQHFNFTRQKSDLTHSKTSENMAFNSKASKGSVRQARNNKNHLQLLKSVASPRLPLKSTNSNRSDNVDEDGMFKPNNSLADHFPVPPAQFCNQSMNMQTLSKSDSFDFSFSNKISFDPDSNVVTLDKIINIEDFPPPPASLEFGDSNHEIDTVTNNVEEKSDKDNFKASKKSSKDEKKSKKETKSSSVKSTKQDSKSAQNNAFMSELYESFRIKAQKEASKDHDSKVASSTVEPSSNTKESKIKNPSTKSSFSFKRTISKPEPNCPAPAVPVPPVNISHSKFYTKDVNESSNQSPSVDAEYVTPVLKKIPLKPIESMRNPPEQEQNELKSKSKPSKLAMFFNSNSKSGNKGKDKSNDLKKTTDQCEADSLTKSVISNSGYDADDESKRHSAGNISNYKKFWESQSSNTCENDSGLGSCSSSNAASKSNDSVISVGSLGSSSDSTKVQTSVMAVSSPKLISRGNSSRIPKASASFLKKNVKLAESIANSSRSSVDNIPQKCLNEENVDSNQGNLSKPT